MAVVEHSTHSKSRAALYHWQTWIHVGPDAENCEDVSEQEGTNSCANPLHFHAWVRLPNPYQERDLSEKATAAKARRIRLYREIGSDLGEILENEVETLARKGDAVRDQVIEALIANDWYLYVYRATRELDEERDEDDKLVWEHIHEDRLRRQEIDGMPEEERPDDERRMLERRLDEYERAYQEKRTELERPLREELGGLDVSALLDRYRDMRIDAEGSSTYQQVRLEWAVALCTYRQPEGGLLFGAPSDLQEQPDSVVEALLGAFRDLEQEKGGQGLGNL